MNIKIITNKNLKGRHRRGTNPLARPPIVITLILYHKKEKVK